MKRIITFLPILLSISVLLDSVTSLAFALPQADQLPMNSQFWNQQKNQGSIKDMYNHNTNMWNDWFGNGNTRYKFYTNIDLQMDMMANARARQQQAQQNAQYNAYQNWLFQQPINPSPYGSVYGRQSLHQNNDNTYYQPPFQNIPYNQPYAPHGTGNWKK